MHVALAYARLSVGAEAEREPGVPRTNIFRDCSQNLFVAFSVFGHLRGSSVVIEESTGGQLIIWD